MTTEPHERLQRARAEAGFTDATAAAEAMNLPAPTYLAHENGSRGLARSGRRYADFFHVSLEWLLTGKGTPRRQKAALAGEQATVPLVGYVSAGAQAHYFAQDSGHLDEVPAVGPVSEATVAVEIRGDSLGSFFDRWLVYYDDVRRPASPDLIGKLCVIGLEDGRIVIKKITRSKTRGLYHLLSQTEDPIFDVEISWAAKVKNMVPR